MIGSRPPRPNWTLLFAIAWVAGICLRLAWPGDMEFKEDEEYNSWLALEIAAGRRPWPWVGMPSGVYVPNPGLSIGLFALLARLWGATDAIGVAQSVRVFALLGIAAAWLLGETWVRREAPGSLAPWRWAICLSLVNPLSLLYQRKLWPEPLLLLPAVLLLAGWWRRDRRGGALLWGALSALLGQIHLSGFFLAAALGATTLFRRGGRRARWGWVILGALVGALPLAPWALEVWRRAPFPAGDGGWIEAIQLKWWVFWASNAGGLHLGNALGIHLGPRAWDQLREFLPHPRIPIGDASVPTYGVLLAHLAALAACLRLAVPALRQTWDALRIRRRGAAPDPVEAAERSALLWTGILLTATGVRIRRYYLMVSFPFELTWLARAGQRSRWALPTLFAAQLAMSAGFVTFIHERAGAPEGDYGETYERVMAKRPPGALPPYEWARPPDP